VARTVTIFCVGAGALAFAVGQACGAPRPATLAPSRPDLVIPPLDTGRIDRTAPGDGIRFGHPVAEPGSGWNVVVHASSRSADGPSGEQISSYESAFRVEVLAVDGPAPSRVSLRFERNVYGYQGREAPTVIDGKEYVVDARAPHVRVAGGAAAPEAETERVLDVFPDLGTRARIDEVLPDASMRVGDTRDELAGAILRVIHPRAWTLRAGSATLSRSDGSSAVFDVIIDASSTSGLHVVLKGEAHVALRDSQLVDLRLDGTYEGERDGGADAPPGTFSLRRTLTSAATSAPTSDQAPRSDR
jgi:hypothetical protein